MNYTLITGGCYCGRVRYAATQQPICQANCHCANCRRAAGAQAVAWITVPQSHFQFEKGTPKRYRTDTGAWRTFCESCGTSLTYERDARPGEIDITTGSLDRPEDFPPNRDVFREERLPWVRLVDPSAGSAAPQFLGIYRLVPRLHPESAWTKADETGVREHFERLQAGAKEGKVILAGRTLEANDRRFGIVVFEGANENEARAFMESDPAVLAGVMTFELHACRVAVSR